MDQVDYRTVTACLRPPRFAVLYRTGNDWVHHARQVLKSISRFWGGAGAVMLPLGVDGKLAPSILEMLRLYDPDMICGHVVTLGDLAATDSDAATRIAQKVARDGEDPQVVLIRRAGEALNEQPWDDAAAQINERCSPFKGFDQRAQVFNGREVHWLEQTGTVDGLTMMPAVADDNRVLTLRLDDVAASLALMIETRSGAASTASLPGFEVLQLGVSQEDVPGFLRFAVTGKPEMSTWDAHTNYLRAKGLLELPQPPALLTPAQYATETPMAVPAVGLSGFRTAKRQSYAWSARPLRITPWWHPRSGVNGDVA